MKTLVLYYTLGGHCQKEAKKIALQKEDSDLYQVKEVKKRNIFTAFIPGCPHAMKRKASLIQSIKCDYDQYDQIDIVSPIWAGYPSPAFQAIINTLPQGKKIEVYFVSGGGETPKSKDETIQLLKNQFELIDYHDIKCES